MDCAQEVSAWAPAKGGEASAADAEDLPALGPSGHGHPHPAGGQRHLNGAAERCLRQPHGDARDQVVSLSRKARVVFYNEGNVEVSGRAAIFPHLAAAFEAEARPAGHPGGDGHGELLLPPLDPLAPADLATLGGDLAAPMTAPAGALEGEPRDAGGLPAAVAVCARVQLGRLGVSLPLAAATGPVQIHSQLLPCALPGFSEGELEVDLYVNAWDWAAVIGGKEVAEGVDQAIKW